VPVTASLRTRATHAALSLACAPIPSRLEILILLEQGMGRLPHRHAELSILELQQRLEGFRYLQQEQMQEQMKPEEPEHALGLPELMMGDDDVDLDNAALLGDLLPAAGVPSIITTKPGDPGHIYKQVRVVWTDADKKALISGIRKHKNAWAKMVRDDTLHFSKELSCSLPKVFANKLKAYARSPAFKAFVASQGQAAC
jgi:hypothetical protein